jgi:hypothetical protein
MLTDHFDREKRKLVWPRDKASRDRAQKGSGGRITQTGVNEPDVTGVVVPSEVIGLNVDALRHSIFPSALHRVGRGNAIRRRKLVRDGGKVHEP